MATYTVHEVADTLIAECRRSKNEISNLKLQKLLYYAQAWSLALHKKSLFTDDFEAWIHGPVVPVVFRRFKSYRWNEIGDVVSPLKDPELVTHLRNILKVYGAYSPSQLERLSHSERPWKEARRGKEPDESGNDVISKQSMKEFYSDLSDGKKTSRHS